MSYYEPVFPGNKLATIRELLSCRRFWEVPSIYLDCWSWKDLSASGGPKPPNLPMDGQPA